MGYTMDARLEAMICATSDRSMGLAEFCELPLPDHMTRAAAWDLTSGMRYAQRMELPFAAADDLVAGRRRMSWLYPTRLLLHLERCCLLTGTNSPHVSTTLLTPEGRHLKLAHLMRDCRAGVAQMGGHIGAERATRVALEVERPAGAYERLLVQMYKVAVDELGVAATMPTAPDVARLYERCMRGERLGAHGEPDQAAIARILDGSAQLGGVLGALVCLQAFIELTPLPTANGFVGRLACARMLRAQGLSLLSYLPVLGYIASWHEGALDGRVYQPVCTPRDAVLPLGDTLEWTRYFEELMRYVADEAWWLSNKLTRMAVRRRRLEELLRLDATFNERQQAVLVEACVHDDAEFTFDGLVNKYDIAYSTAHDDLEGLERAGYLASERHGKRLYFVAAQGVLGRLLGVLRASHPDVCARYFDGQNKLVGVDLPRWDPTAPPRAAVAAVDYEADVRGNYPVLAGERRLAIAKDGHRDGA